jgi:hypothetical protein
MFTSQQIVKTLATLQSPAFRFDDAGLDVFDSVEPAFRKALEKGSEEDLQWALWDYKSRLLSLADELDWFSEDYKDAAVSATQSLSV